MYNEVPLAENKNFNFTDKELYFYKNSVENLFWRKVKQIEPYYVGLKCSDLPASAGVPGQDNNKATRAYIGYITVRCASTQPTQVMSTPPIHVAAIVPGLDGKQWFIDAPLCVSDPAPNVQYLQFQRPNFIVASTFQIVDNSCGIFMPVYRLVAFFKGYRAYF